MASSLEDLSRPSEPGTAPKPPSSPEASSLGERVALAVALCLATVGLVVPGIMLLWFVALTLITGATAEALEHSGGLEPTTFGGGYWLAVGLDAGVVLWCLVRRLRGRPAPWKPLVGLAAVYVTLIWFVLFPDMATRLDVPDVITTFALLGTDALATYVLPIVLLACWLHAWRHLWRAGRGSSLAAQQIGGVAGCLGLGVITLGAGLAVVDLEPKTLDVALDEFVSALDVGGAEGERRMYAALSLGLGSGLSSGNAAESQGANGFAQCADTLSTPRLDGRPVVELATRRLMNGGMSKADAEDLVMDTLLRVCMKHADARIHDVIPYYWGALKRNANSFHRRAGHGQVPWDDALLLEDERDLPADDRLALAGEIATLRAAQGRLSLADRYVLHLRYVDGMSYADMGVRMAKSEASTRQQVERARDRLERAWRQEVHRH